MEEQVFVGFTFRSDNPDDKYEGDEKIAPNTWSRMYKELITGLAQILERIIFGSNGTDNLPYEKFFTE
jgi:hypothetical protein